MNVFAKDDRTLLDLARDAAEPTSADRARVRATLARRLGAAAGLGMAAGIGVSAKAAAAAGAGGGSGAATAAGAVVKGGGVLATKLIGAAIVVSAGVVGGAVAVHHAHPTTVAAIVAARPAGGRAGGRQRSEGSLRQVTPAVPDQPKAPPAPPPEAPPAPSPEAPGPADISRPRRAVLAKADGKEPRAVTPARISAGPSSPAPRSAVPAVEPSPKASSPEAPPAAERRDAETPQPRLPSARVHVERSSQPIVPSATAGLADEARLVREGVAAMRAGNPARAVVLFDAHARAYPHGVLAVEREAERALALADLDRPSVARAALAEFLRAHPDSPLIATVRKRLRALDAAPAGTTSGSPRP